MKKHQKSPRSTKKLLTWTYSHIPGRKSGTVKIAGIGKEFWIHSHASHQARNGDIVQIQIQKNVFLWYQSAYIVAIEKRFQTIFIGILVNRENTPCIFWDNDGRPTYIPLKKGTRKYIHSLPENPYWIAFRLKEDESHLMVSEIIEYWEKPDAMRAKLKNIVFCRGIDPYFPKKVEKKAKKCSFQEQKSRKNLTTTFTMTIDSPSAKDLDDAISVEKIGENYRLVVSIADVSEYVAFWWELDKEAQKRWNSIYLPSEVIPMLPAELSDTLCSLLPGTKKATLSCDMLFSPDGKLLKRKVYTSQIQSDYRLTYDEVDEILSGNKSLNSTLHFERKVSKKLQTHLQRANELSNILNYKKDILGMVRFSFADFHIDTDAHMMPKSISPQLRTKSSKIIEAFMIAANETVAHLFQNILLLYRTHEEPDSWDIVRMKQLCSIFGIDIPDHTLTPKGFWDILKDIEWHPCEKILQRILLRSMKKAVYAVENTGHFGVGATHYAHFTSPIRRYADLHNHRIIKMYLKNQYTKKQKKLFDNLEDIAKHISDTKTRAEKIEYAAQDLLVCEYYGKQIGTYFSGMITSLAPFWIFVEIENGVEWILFTSQLRKQIPTRNIHISHEEGKILFWKDFSLQIGEHIEVQLIKIDRVKNRLEFDFLGKIDSLANSTEE